MKFIFNLNIIFFLVLLHRIFIHIQNVKISLYLRYVRGGDALRNRRELAAGVTALDSWLAAADNLLGRQPRASTHDIQAYIDQLLQLNSEIEHHEELFKNISRLVSTSPQSNTMKIKQ